MKNKYPLVSIVVPAYNVEVFLAECINSILSQTYINIEVIIINDGSIDNTAKIAEYYKEKDERIVVKHQINGGASSAKNSGIGIAKGELITFIDSDDYIRKDFIHNLAEDITENNVKFVTTPTDIVFSMEDEPNIIVLTQYEAYKRLFYGTLEGSDNGVQMFERAFIVENNILFDTNKKIGEDFDFLAKALSQCDRVAVDYRKMYYYRPNPTSVMRQKINTDIMKSIYTFSDIGEWVVTKHPQLQKSVNAKKFSDAVALLIRSYHVRKDWQKDYSNLLVIVGNLKWGVLKDNNVRKKVRLAALIYCIFGNSLGNKFINEVIK